MKRSAQMYLSLIFLFILGNHNGFIALWQGQSPLPARIFPYSVSALPKSRPECTGKGHHRPDGRGAEPHSGGLFVIKVNFLQFPS